MPGSRPEKVTILGPFWLPARDAPRGAGSPHGDFSVFPNFSGLSVFSGSGELKIGYTKLMYDIESLQKCSKVRVLTETAVAMSRVLKNNEKCSGFVDFRAMATHFVSIFVFSKFWVS